MSAEDKLDRLSGQLRQIFDKVDDKIDAAESMDEIKDILHIIVQMFRAEEEMRMNLRRVLIMERRNNDR